MGRCLLSHKEARRRGVPQKMEVILTLSNRISLAGAIPLLVAVAIAVLVAAIALAPSKPTSAFAENDNCKLSPLLLDMLLDRYDMKSHQCNTLDLSGTLPTLADGEKADTWDFSSQELSSFAISDDDAGILKVLTGSDADGTGGTVVEAGVRYIDLTGNPLTVDDVSFKNIPNNVAVILSAESNVAGFQAEEFEVTEAAASYISVAFPGIHDDDAVTDDPATAPDESDMTVTVTIGGDGDDAANTATTPLTLKRQHVNFGVSADAANASAARTFVANSGADNVIFYWPITVDKDNENDEDWDISLTILEVVGATGITNANANFDLLNDEADVTILDADAPMLSVCDRSEDVEEAILDYAGDTTGARGGQAGADGFGGNTRCDDITLRDLGTIPTLNIMDADTEDAEAIEDLVAGDFEGMAGLTTLHIVGARSLPAGIFAGVGKAGTDTVEITFANNSPPADSDADKVGDFKPSTIPSHIWADQEKQQVIVLSDDTNAKGEGTTSGLDAGLYAADEGGSFFVLTNAATSAYILGSKVDFAALGATDANPIMRPAIADRGGGPGKEKSKVVRFAISVPEDDDDKDGNLWLFLFDFDKGATASNTDVASVSPPTNASDLRALATVAITDND